MTNLELVEKIKELKVKKNAIILAHYYQKAEVQDIADYVGDSLALSQLAASTDKDIIVFCGVDFMAETAKILSPDKKVLLPAKKASCFMAEMMDSSYLKKYKENNPDTKIIIYVNSTASCKAYADCCVTSSNALKVIKHYGDLGYKMLYCPDQNLGMYAIKQYGYKMECYPGFCPVHNNIKISDIKALMQEHPKALFIAHPECKLDVLDLASYIGSTKQLIEFSAKSEALEFIVGTEEGVIHEMEKRSPNKKFYGLTNKMICKNMKLTSLEDVYNTLNLESNEINVDEETSKKAKVCLDKMLELSK